MASFAIFASKTPVGTALELKVTFWKLFSQKRFYILLVSTLRSLYQNSLNSFQIEKKCNINKLKYWLKLSFITYKLDFEKKNLKLLYLINEFITTLT